VAILTILTTAVVSAASRQPLVLENPGSKGTIGRWNNPLVRLLRIWVFAFALALLFLGTTLNRPCSPSIEGKVAAVAHSACTSPTDYEALIALGEKGRPTYHRLLHSPDHDVRWAAALFLTKLPALPRDPFCRAYLLHADDRDVAAMTLLRSLCEAHTSDAHAAVSRVLTGNPGLSPLVAQLLMSDRRSEEDARFRAFLAHETSTGALRSLQRGVKFLRPCRRHQDLLLAVDRRLGEIETAG
jgi:hypothetical protein